jgi:hypothetical protein
VTSTAILRTGASTNSSSGKTERIAPTTSDSEVPATEITWPWQVPRATLSAGKLASVQEGRLKHVRIAVQVAMPGPEPDRSTALSYLRTLAQRQVKAGARFLDVNVDEVSTKLDYQLEAMRWLVRELAPLDNVRLSIDSSNLEIISAGITEASQAAGTRVGPPMLNSASLERIEALDLAAQLRGPVVVTAAGESGMPTDAEGRVLSASRMVEASLAAGILLGRIFVDPLVFPSTSNGLWPRTGRAARSKSPSTFSPVSMRTVGRT